MRPWRKGSNKERLEPGPVLSGSIGFGWRLTRASFFFFRVGTSAAHWRAPSSIGAQTGDVEPGAAFFVELMQPPPEDR